VTSWRRQLDPAAWRRVLVFAPHPDDETLATGGLLQRAVAAGAAVRVVFVTDGEDNPWPQRALERRWRIGPAGRARWAARRHEETLAALACLGVSAASAVFLHFPDQGLTPLLLSGGDAVVSALAAELVEWRPTLVVAPSAADLHPDHSALGVLLHLAVDHVGRPSGRGFTELAYVVHGNAPIASAFRLQLSPAERARKLAAIGCHRSQLVLSRRRFLSQARATERFIDPDMPSSAHRVRAATFACNTLSLQLAPPRSFAGTLPATLHVLTAEGPGGPIRWQSRRVGPWQRRVELPFDRMPARLLVKCEGPHVFFDDAGWREMHLGGEAEGRRSSARMQDEPADWNPAASARKVE